MAVVCESLIMIRYKENVLRLEIGVNQVKIMQDWGQLSVTRKVLKKIILTGNASKQLTGETLYLTAGKRHKGIAFEKIKDALSE